MPEEKLRIGVLGAANIAKKNVRAIGLATNGLREKALVCPAGFNLKLLHQASLIQTSSAAGTAKALGSYQAVLDDPDVDAVYIPLPTSLHVEWVKKAAAARKHVLCEKPISLSVADAKEIVAACKDAGVQWMDGTMLAHNPRLAKMELAKAALGPPAFLEGDIRVSPALDGLGCLGDLGWYCVRMSLWAFDYDLPTTVAAHAGAAYNAAGVLMHCGATLLWDDGRRATLECGFDRSAVQFCEVAGMCGALALDDFCIPRVEANSAFVKRGEGFLAELDTRIAQPRETITVMLERPQDALMWEEFARCVYAIRTGGAPNTWWPDISLRTQRVVCAVEESARTQRPVSIAHP